MVENLEMLAFTKKCEFNVVKQLFETFNVPYQIDEEVQNGVKFYEILYNLEDCENLDDFCDKLEDFCIKFNC